MQYELRDFDQDVLEASRTCPVLVDFWAAWCGPCRQLGPIVEKLAAEAGERWALVKVDTEARPDLAQAYQIRGIPNLKLFHRGQVIAELPGALPEPQLRAWLDENLPSPARDRLAAARAAGDPAEARRLVEEAVALDPNLPEAAIVLAGLLVAEDPARAEALARAHRAAPGADEVLQVLALVAEPLPDDGSPAAAHARAGVAALAAGRHADAAEAFLALAEASRRWHDGFPAKAFRTLFGLLGPQHQVTRDYRRRADLALY
jgi:putative thioredoxin